MIEKRCNESSAAGSAGDRSGQVHKNGVFLDCSSTSREDRHWGLGAAFVANEFGYAGQLSVAELERDVRSDVARAKAGSAGRDHRVKSEATSKCFAQFFGFIWDDGSLYHYR